MIVDDNTLITNEYQVITPLENKKSYYWHIKKKNRDKLWGDWSATWSFTVDIILQVPSNPSPSSGSTITDTTPLLNWEDIASESGYHIQINKAIDFTDTIIADDDTLTLSEYQIYTVLADNTTYYWWVRIKNEDGVPGEWSSIWSFTIDIAPPASPSPSSGSLIIDAT